MLAAAERTLCWHLGGDEAYTNRLTKNPWNKDAWSTIWWPNARPLELSEILAYSDIDPANDIRRRRKPDTLFGFGRNVGIFDATRFYAYEHFRDCDHEIFDFAYAENSKLSAPLPHAEVNSIARSVCKFMREKYKGSQGPRYTKRKSNTAANMEAVIQAEEALRAAGQRPTAEALATVTGLGRATVERTLRKLAEAGRNQPPRAFVNTPSKFTLSGIPPPCGGGESRQLRRRPPLEPWHPRMSQGATVYGVGGGVMPRPSQKTAHTADPPS